MAIVEAVAVSCGRSDQKKTGLAQVMETTMQQVIAQAYEDGLAGDPDAIKARMTEARSRVKEAFAKAQESNPEG